jgi:ssDNA-binding Zn-finger/Zn-ribbon topoisomerase 1
MGVKVKGGMWCPNCGAVAAQKSTHRFRNVAATLTLPLTGGASALGYAAGGWMCTNCGGPVYSLKQAEAAAEAQKPATPAETPEQQARQRGSWDCPTCHWRELSIKNAKCPRCRTPNPFANTGAGPQSESATPTGKDPVELLTELKDLLEAGAITEEEFAEQKERILN